MRKIIAATTSVILDKRIQRKNGAYAVKLRVIFQRIAKYYPLGIYLTPEDWEKVIGEKPRNDFKNNKVFINQIEIKAINIIKSLPSFSFRAFESAFNKQTDLSKNVFSLFDDYIKELKDKKQHGTADSYGNAKSSFQEFLKDKNRKKLNLGDITPEWLQEYEDWMILNEKSITTVGIYCRSLRRIINITIKDGLFNKDFYPFGKQKYQIPGGRNIKKALSLKEVQLLYTFQPANDSESKALDLWFLSYLCNGANMQDLARLQFKSIETKTLKFIREKTKRTTKQDIQPILVSLIPETKDLIKKLAIVPKTENDYVLGVIDGNETEDIQRTKIKQANKVANKHLKRIGQKLELPSKLTLGVSRHTWATVMKNFGASDELVGEGLGHQLVSSTKNYLGSFEDKVREKYQNQLLKF
jgi:integrase/recombinase XerD